MINRFRSEKGRLEQRMTSEPTTNLIPLTTIDEIEEFTFHDDFSSCFIGKSSLNVLQIVFVYFLCCNENESN